jgi:hypothetical protein
MWMYLRASVKHCNGKIETRKIGKGHGDGESEEAKGVYFGVVDLRIGEPIGICNPKQA